MVIICIVIAIIAFVGILFLFRKKDGDNFNNVEYRNYVYTGVKDDFKPYLRNLFNEIDEIDVLVNKCNASLDKTAYEAMIEIYNRANITEEKIKKYWNNTQFYKDFYFYISLHYASHLLGMKIKQEQLIIRNSFVECKANQKQWGEKIEKLKYKQQNSSGKVKRELSQEIAACCNAHKQISNLASGIGEANTKYRQRATQQSIETAKRRDFIADNFGKKGQQWKRRMHQRALERQNIK